MCEFSRKLVVWMDHELGRDEAAEVEQHVAACTECRSCVAEFKRVSGEFSAYCDALAQSKGRGRTARREPILWATAAAVVLAAIFAYPRRQVSPIPQPEDTTVAMSKASRDSTRDSSAKPATNEVEAGTAAISPLPANTRRTHGNRLVANRGAACCSLTTMRGATANAAAAATPSVTAHNANWIANEPSVQIAFPAAAMFPPGAVPEGINFVADLSIGADGSVQQVRLQPQVFEPERRSSQP